MTGNRNWHSILCKITTKNPIELTESSSNVEKQLLNTAVCTHIALTGKKSPLKYTGCPFMLIQVKIYFHYSYLCIF